MFERFTEGARRVIAYAQQEAVSLRHREIGSTHLLLAVLCTDDAAVQAAARQAALTVEAVRESVPPAKRRFEWGRSGHIPFDADARQALEGALRAAKELQHREVRPVHLLIGMLANAGGGAAVLLSARGVDVPTLAAAARSADGDGGDDPPAE